MDPGSPGLADNKTWNAADPTSVCKVDGLYGADLNGLFLTRSKQRQYPHPVL